MRSLNLSIALLCLISTKSLAQDFSSTNPKFVQVLGDTLNTKLLLFSMPPGTTTTLHTHPSQIIYAIEGGTIKVEYSDGKTETIKMKTGQSLQAPPDPPHKTTNVGNTTFKVIVVELPQ